MCDIVNISKSGNIFNTSILCATFWILIAINASRILKSRIIRDRHTFCGSTRRTKILKKFSFHLSSILFYHFYLLFTPPPHLPLLTLFFTILLVALNIVFVFRFLALPTPDVSSRYGSVQTPKTFLYFQCKEQNTFIIQIS